MRLEELQKQTHFLVHWPPHVRITVVHRANEKQPRDVLYALQRHVHCRQERRPVELDPGVPPGLRPRRIGPPDAPARPPCGRLIYESALLTCTRVRAAGAAGAPEAAGAGGAAEAGVVIPV